MKKIMHSSYIDTDQANAVLGIFVKVIEQVLVSTEAHLMSRIQRG